MSYRFLNIKMKLGVLIALFVGILIWVIWNNINDNGDVPLPGYLIMTRSPLVEISGMIPGNIENIWWNEEYVICQNRLDDEFKVPGSQFVYNEKETLHFIIDIERKKVFIFDNIESYYAKLKALQLNDKVVLINFLNARKLREEELGIRLDFNNSFGFYRTWKNMTLISEVLEMYHDEHNKFPNTLGDLVTEGRFAEDSFLDMWGHEINYTLSEKDGDYYYTLASEGPRGIKKPIIYTSIPGYGMKKTHLEYYQWIICR